MARLNEIRSGGGTDCNRVRIGGVTELLGDPKVRIEKPYTIVLFPGGDVEIARTSDGDYWVHVAVRGDPGQPTGRITRARLDHRARYNNEGNAALQSAIDAEDVEHVAFLVTPPMSRGIP